MKSSKRPAKSAVASLEPVARNGITEPEPFDDANHESTAQVIRRQPLRQKAKKRESEVSETSRAVATSSNSESVAKSSERTQLPYGTGTIVEPMVIATNGPIERKRKSRHVERFEPNRTSRLNNVVQFIDSRTLSRQSSRSSLNVREAIMSKIVINGLKDFGLHQTPSSFTRRGTTLEWHPFHSNLVAAGAKYGDIHLLDLNTPANNVYIQGRGPGGVMQDLKFLHEPLTTSCRVVTASMDGTVSLRDFRNGAEQILMGTKAWQHEFWPCSVDVSALGDVVVSGDSKGTTTLMSLDGQKIWSWRLHKCKVNHVEFHPLHKWLLCTASTDGLVSLWDLRSMGQGKKDCLQQVQHSGAINCATFSRTNGQRILVTDQQHHLYVYLCATLQLEKTFVHPHRQFQHLTPIKASWHPLQDIAVVGRYPDPKLHGYVDGEHRGVDMFDMTSLPQPVCQLYDATASQIISLCKFNNIGSMLATIMGSKILIWKNSENILSDEPRKVPLTERNFNQLNNDSPSLVSLPGPIQLSTGMSGSTGEQARTRVSRDARNSRITAKIKEKLKDH